MADSKLSALTEETVPVDADLMYLVDDVAGTPTSKRITWANIKAAVRSALVSDTAYGSGWNGDTTVAPSKNAVYDAFVPFESRALVRKTSDESVTSSTTLQDDNDLLFAIAANEVWSGLAVISYEGATAGDLSLGLNAPSGATVQIGIVGAGIGVSTSTGDTARFASRGSVGAFGLGALGAGTLMTAFVTFYVANSTTPGNVNIQWAQSASSGTATTVKAGSFLRADRFT